MDALTFEKRVRESLKHCPGGDGCTCCRPGCDCGCRDACPVFRRMIRRQHISQALAAGVPLHEIEDTLDQEENDG